MGGWESFLPVGGKEEDVRTGGIHLVGLAGVDGFLLDVLYLQSVEFLVEDLERVGG